MYSTGKDGMGGLFNLLRELICLLENRALFTNINIQERIKQKLEKAELLFINFDSIRDIEAAYLCIYSCLNEICEDWFDKTKVPFVKIKRLNNLETNVQDYRILLVAYDNEIYPILTKKKSEYLKKPDIKNTSTLIHIFLIESLSSKKIQFWFSKTIQHRNKLDTIHSEKVRIINEPIPLSQQNRYSNDKRYIRQEIYFCELITNFLIYLLNQEPTYKKSNMEEAYKFTGEIKKKYEKKRPERTEPDYYFIVRDLSNPDYPQELKVRLNFKNKIKEIYESFNTGDRVLLYLNYYIKESKDKTDYFTNITTWKVTKLLKENE